MPLDAQPRGVVPRDQPRAHFACVAILLPLALPVIIMDCNGILTDRPQTQTMYLSCWSCQAKASTRCRLARAPDAHAQRAKLLYITFEQDYYNTQGGAEALADPVS